MSKKKPPEDRISSIAPFGLRIPADLRDRIAKAAAAKNRSMNTEILELLKERYPPNEEIEELLSTIEQLLDYAVGNDWRDNRKFLTESLKELRDRIRTETPK